MVLAAVWQAAAGRRPVACRLLAAAVAHLIPVAVVGLWSREASFLLRAPEWPMVLAAVWRAAAGRRSVACRLLAAAVAHLIPAAADLLWFRGRSASAPGQVRPAAVSAKAPAMADRRRAACHSPVVSRRAAPGREADCSADWYSESGSLLERPMAGAMAR